MRKPNRRDGGGSPALPPALAGLEELSRNLWWSWDTHATALWDSVADKLHVPDGERSPRNPVRWLRRASGDSLAALAGDAGTLQAASRAVKRCRQAARPRKPRAGLPRLPGPVAYFSMEFGVHESLPIYAGGLGVLAGDHAKSASDLGLPLIGVSLFYRNGYFRQGLNVRGKHVVSFPRADLAELPIEPFRDAGGRPVVVRVELPGRTVALQALRARVGRTDLLLLDSDLPQNSARDRSLTHRLYIGDRELRISQEVLCGIGGVRALRALRLAPSVWHMNEGHVVFLTLERIRELVVRGLDFCAAAEAVAANCVFTTHTPVAEGNEVFALDLARRFLRRHCEAAKVPVEDYLRLGLDHGPGGRPILSMTVLALRLSRFRNGVSRLHGDVSRHMWHRLWPGFSVDRVPIGHVTNGVHTPTWVALEYDDLYRERLGRRWEERLDDFEFWKEAHDLPERALWETKRHLKEELIRFVRYRVRARLVAGGVSPESARREADRLLSPDALTIGFARRFALYKRSALLFRDRARAKKLFGDPSRPVQIIFAGKPHPEDPQGAGVFEEIARISKRPEFAGRVVILESYDLDMARRLVQGSDLWLNTPRRPLEASGTSGQKVSINCGLNCSVLDGWWDEAYTPEVGWAIGKPTQSADPKRQDEEDSTDLHRVLEREVVPLYFRRGRDGLPRGWLAKVKASLARLVPQFSSARMVAEYGRLYYEAAAAGGRRLEREGARDARSVADWRGRVERCWPLAHVVRATRLPPSRFTARHAQRSTARSTQHRAEVEIFVAGLAPGDLGAQVLTNGSDWEPPPAREPREGVVRYTFPLRGPQPARLRVWPRHASLPHPTELGLSLEAEV